MAYRGRTLRFEDFPSWHNGGMQLSPVFQIATVMSMNTEFAPLFKLARAERLQLVEDLWDSIAQETESSPIPEFQLEEVQGRKARFLADPTSGRTWEEVKLRARTQHD